MMSESTPSVPLRIRSSTASIPCVNSAIAAQAHHGRRPLQAVGCSERPIKMRAIALTPLEVHQPFFEADEQLARLFVEHLTESIFRTRAQSQSPIECALLKSNFQMHLTPEFPVPLPSVLLSNLDNSFSGRIPRPLARQDPANPATQHLRLDRFDQPSRHTLPVFHREFVCVPA